MVTAKKYVLKHEVEKVLPSDLVLVEEELPPLKDGEYLAKAEYLSVDIDCVYMRKTYPCNSTMDGLQLAKIVESKNPDYPVGKRIVGFLGWRTYTILDPKDNRSMLNLPPYILPEMDFMDWDISLSISLGTLGPLGNMAYLALKEMCEAKPGQTLVINGADLSVGLHVGQIAKIMGLNVIGICSSKANCEYLRRDLKFDSAIDRKGPKRLIYIRKEIRKFTSDGVDLFFDINGGEISNLITHKMKEFGRIVVCGSVVNYKATEISMNDVELQPPAIVWNKLRMDGLLFSRWYDRWNEGFEQNLRWMREGKLCTVENNVLGFEKMLQTYDDVMEGNSPLKYFGKVVVQV